MAAGLPRLGPGFQLKNADPCLLQVWHTGVETVFCLERRILSLVGLAECRYCTTFARHVAFPRCGCIRHHPGCIIVSYGRDVVVNVREDLRVRVRQEHLLWRDPMLDGMDNLRYHWLHVAGSSGGPSTCLRKTQGFCVVFALEYGCEEDCGVGGSPGGVHGRPFGMDQSLFVGFGTL